MMHCAKGTAEASKVNTPNKALSSMNCRENRLTLRGAQVASTAKLRLAESAGRLTNMYESAAPPEVARR
jgi:hypothetical protein